MSYDYNGAVVEADEEGYIEPHVWSGIGRARSGCGSAIVGDPDQVLAKINRYINMGMRAFIFSGYPHIEECELFARDVLPQLKTCRLAQEKRRWPSDHKATTIGLAGSVTPQP